MRRRREGVLPEAKHESALAMLNEDLAATLVVELTSEVVACAQGLLQRHALRAGDAIQLASCLHLRDELEEAISLVAFDERLAVAARKEKVPLA